ncbi:MAG: LysR substrate-binding domain-containing protein [Pseudomonadota bacterium]
MSNYDRSGPASDLLHTFCVVAELGNVTQAADALSKTQSAVSVKIRNLEEQLSVSLFKRMARGVQLTDAGNRLLPVAKKAMLEIDRIGELFSNHLTGQIRVGIPDDYNETILEQALARFCARHKQVEVFIRSGCTASYPEAIDKGELDLAIYSGMPGKSTDAFSNEPTVWVASNDFVLSEYDPIPLAIFDRDCRWRNVPTDTLDAAQKHWRISYVTENMASYKAAIRAGLAIGMMAKSTVESSFQILDEKQGLPLLPETSRRFLKNRSNQSEIVDEMESAILDSLNR